MKVFAIKIIFILFLLFIELHAFAQFEISDSLFNKLNTTPFDTNKLNTLSKQSNEITFTDSNEKELTQFSMQYELDKQQQDKELKHQTEILKRESKLKQQKTVTISVLIVLSLFIIFSLLIFISNRIIKSKNYELELKNQEILHQKEIIRTQHDKIKRELEETIVKQEKLEKERILYQFKALAQQMNPHFIFNTLNSIQYFIYQNDKESSTNYLAKFASLMRKTLYNSREDFVSVKEEIEAISLYLELEKMRFQNKFEFEIHIDEEIDKNNYKIPTLLIQPYLENSIWHGITHLEGKGLIKLQLKNNVKNIICIIEDNGIGRKKAAEINTQKRKSHVSMGASITEKRIELINVLYKQSLTINYTDIIDEKGNPKGTKVEINIPFVT
jgi:sensor histidine kinase YesM